MTLTRQTSRGHALGRTNTRRCTYSTSMLSLSSRAGPNGCARPDVEEKNNPVKHMMAHTHPR